MLPKRSSSKLLKPIGCVPGGIMLLSVPKIFIFFIILFFRQKKNNDFALKFTKISNSGEIIYHFDLKDLTNVFKIGMVKPKVTLTIAPLRKEQTF